MNNQQSPFPVIILGMHRSGTSCLAGSLQEAGLYLGDVNEQAPYNAKGNRENRAVMDLNDSVLKSNDGNWDKPPNKVVWNSKQRARRDQLIQSYPADRTWGFKDPRTLLTLEGWLEAIPKVRFIGTFRHPMAVASSLKARDGFPIKKSLLLWMSYNRLLLEYQRKFNFDLLSFDLPTDQYHKKLSRIVEKLNLTEPERGFSFFESKLRKNQAKISDADLPEPVLIMYRKLQEIAG